MEIQEVAVCDSGSVIPQASIEKNIPDTPGFLVISNHSMDGDAIGEHTESKALLQIKRIVSDESGSVFVACIGFGKEYGGQSFRNRGIAFVARMDSLGSFNWVRAISAKTTTSQLSIYL